MDIFLRSDPWFHPGEDRERFWTSDLARGDQFLMHYASHLNGTDQGFGRFYARLEFHADVEGGPLLSLR